MKPSLLALFKGLKPAREGLVDDAVDANATANTTDPVQAQQNVDFAAELERLKKLKADGAGGEDTGGSDPVDPPIEDGGDGGSTDTPPVDPDAGNGDGGDPPPEDDPVDPPVEDGGDGKQEPKEGEEPPKNPEEDKGEEDDEEVDLGDDEEAPEEATDVKPVQEAQAAVEALAYATKASELVSQAHDQGVVKPYHAQMVLEGISNYSRIHGLKMTGIAVEGDMPESSMGKVKYIGGKIADFIRQLLAKIKEYFVKIAAWIKEAIRISQERRGIFTKNHAGLMARLKYLQGKPVDEEVLNKAIEKTTIQLNALSYGENSVTDVQEGVRLLALVSQRVGAIIDLGSQTQVINAMVAAGAGDETSLRQSDTIITARELLKIDGATNIFGHEKTLQDNFDRVKGDQLHDQYILHSLIGNVSYTWTLAKMAAFNLDSAVATMIGYNFESKRESGSTDFKPLRSVEECMKVLEIAGNLTTGLSVTSKTVEAMQHFTVKVTEVSASMLKQLEDAGLDERPTTKCAAILGAAPQAMVRLYGNMTLQHAKHMENVIQQLQRWIAESLNVIDSALVEKNKPVA